jgi:hypothetical protein
MGGGQRRHAFGFPDVRPDRALPAPAPLGVTLSITAGFVAHFHHLIKPFVYKKSLPEPMLRVLPYFSIPAALFSETVSSILPW